jgi:hypothetical protein
MARFQRSSISHGLKDAHSIIYVCGGVWDRLAPILLKPEGIGLGRPVRFFVTERRNRRGLLEPYPAVELLEAQSTSIADAFPFPVGSVPEWLRS